MNFVCFEVTKKVTNDYLKLREKSDNKVRNHFDRHVRRQIVERLGYTYAMHAAQLEESERERLNYVDKIVCARVSSTIFFLFRE